MIKETPQNIDAERAVIGACILDKNAVVKALDILTSEMFYIPNHSAIFNVIKFLHSENKVVDILTVIDRLEILNIFDEIGGFEYLNSLNDSVPTTANIDQYAKIVYECYQRRQLINASNEIIQKAYSKEIDIDQIANESERLIIEASKNNSKADLSPAFSIAIERFNRFASIRDGEAVPDEIIATGFSGLDGLLKIYKNNFIILAARPAQGKSTLALNLALGVCIENKRKGTKKPVLIYSLEMSKEEVIDNLIIALSGINRYKIESGNTDEKEWEKVQEAIAIIKETPIFVSSLADVSPSQIRASARRLKSEHGELGMIIIDYLQLLDSDKDKTNYENREKEISKMSRTCKKIAMELYTPVLALSQLSRAVESRQNKRPQLSDLRESGSLEQDADIVMFIYRDEYYNPESTKTRIAEIIIAKQRKGSTETVELYFDGALSKFSSLEKY